jgi:hypothetical protein
MQFMALFAAAGIGDMKSRKFWPTGRFLDQRFEFGWLMAPVW